MQKVSANLQLASYMWEKKRKNIKSVQLHSTKFREYPSSVSWHHVYVEGTRKISTVYIKHIHLSHTLSVIIVCDKVTKRSRLL